MQNVNPYAKKPSHTISVCDSFCFYLCLGRCRGFPALFRLFLSRCSISVLRRFCFGSLFWFCRNLFELCRIHLTLHQCLEVVLFDLLVDHQILRQQFQLIHVHLQDRRCLVVCLFNDLTYFIVDLSGNTVRIIPGRTQVSAQENLALVVAVDHRPQLFAETIAWR